MIIESLDFKDISQEASLKEESLYFPSDDRKNEAMKEVYNFIISSLFCDD